MAGMIDIPATLFGRGGSRCVPTDSLVRLEVRLPAPLVRALVLKSNHTGVPIARIVAAELADLTRQERTSGQK